MKILACAITSGAAAVFLSIGTASGNVFKCIPTEVVVLPDDGSSVTQVAFSFDLSGMKRGANRHVEKATLEWRLSDLPEKNPQPEFSVTRILQTWSRATALNKAPSISDERLSSWQINPMASEVSGGRLVRLEVTELVEGWAAETAANYGVVVSTADLPRALLAEQLGKAQLTILYCFRKDEVTEPNGTKP